ncbi:MAG TPA: TonB-dependent receptor plug domain-containing protein, partial [Steroidobacteraceae bacterium]
MAETEPQNAGRSAGNSLLGKAFGVAIALGGTQAWAQQAPASPAPANPATPSQGKENPTQLGKVSVYDTDLEPASPKFTAPLVDTPMSVIVLPASVMKEAAATSLQDALRNVPGITFAAGEGGTPTGDLPSIRGFNSSGNIYVDGLQDIGVQTRDIFDLEQVEVIKGPDSSIAGRASGGGSINLVSKTAQATDFIEATGTYGSASQWRTTLDGNLKITDSIAARLNFMDMGGGVPGRNSAVRTDKWGIAPTITFGLQSPTRFILGYYHFEDKSTPDYGIPVDYITTGKPLTQTAGVSPQNYYGLTDRDYRRNPVDSGTARLEHDFNDAWSLRSQVRYTDSKNDYVLTLPMVSGTDDVYRLPISNRDETRSIVGGIDLFGNFNTGPVHHSLDAGFEGLREREYRTGESFYDSYNVVSSAGLQGFGASGDCSDPALQASYDCTSLYHPNPRDPWTGTITLNNTS